MAKMRRGGRRLAFGLRSQSQNIMSRRIEREALAVARKPFLPSLELAWIEQGYAAAEGGGTLQAPSGLSDQ